MQEDDDDGENPNNNSFDADGKSSAFDKLLTLFPNKSSEEQQNEGRKEHKKDDYNTSASANNAANANSEQAVDVSNLFEKLLGAGLLSSSAANNESASIPGLESGSKANLPPQESGKTDNKKIKEEKKKIVPNETQEKLLKMAGMSNEKVKPITLKSHHPSLKGRQSAVIQRLYDPSALQCKTCGLRYSSSDVQAYSQHLDWHFRYI